MTFHIGMKVICVDDAPGFSSGRVALTKGAVYTIAAIPPQVRFGERGVFVEEVPQALCRPGLRARRFRPIAEQKTDISSLEQIARDVSAGKPVKIAEPVEA